MMPFLMVSATRAPTRTAPVNSQQAAAKTACFIVRDREETEVAKELATCDDGLGQLSSSIPLPPSTYIVGSDVESIEGSEERLRKARSARKPGEWSERRTPNAKR